MLEAVDAELVADDAFETESVVDSGDDDMRPRELSEDLERCMAAIRRPVVHRRNSLGALRAAGAARRQLEQAAANKPPVLRSAPTRTLRHRCMTPNCPSNWPWSQTGVPVVLVPPSLGHLHQS